MYNDYAGPAAAFGIGFIVLGIAIYLGSIALILWVSYLLMRTAVKNGMLLALRESGGQFPGGGGGGYGAGPRPATPPYPQAPPAPGGHGPAGPAAPGGPAGSGGPAGPGGPGGPAAPGAPGGPASGGPSPVG
jgi:hypothetical protein